MVNSSTSSSDVLMQAASPYRRPFRRFTRWFSGLLAGYFLLTAAMSLVVNPWRINRTPLSLDALDEARDIRKCLRVGKAALANQGDWEVVLFGSSRVEQAFDPASEVFGGRRTVNLAMAAAGVLENVDVGHYTLDRNPDIELILFGLDAGDLHNDHDSRTFTRFDESPFADGGISIERTVNQIIGGRSLMDSISTISNYRKDVRPDRTPLGQWIKPNRPPNLREYVEYGFAKGFEDPWAGWNLSEKSFRQDKANALRDFIVRARREGIEMHVFVPVQHALKTIHPKKTAPVKYAGSGISRPWWSCAMKSTQRRPRGLPLDYGVFSISTITQRSRFLMIQANRCKVGLILGTPWSRWAIL